MKMLLLGCAMALGAVFASEPAVAYTEPYLSTAGYSCGDAPPAQAPVVGRFAGDFEDVFDELHTASYVRCFTSVQACEAWRYDVQSSQIFYNIIYNECRGRG